MDKKYLIIMFVILISTLSFARSFLGLAGLVPWHYGYSDIFNQDRINPATALKLPYLEAPVEYPVITGFFIYLMWFFGKSLLGYAILSYIFLTAFAAITALALYKLCGLLNINKNRLMWFFVFAPSMIFFNVFNWDIMAVMLMVLAIYFFYRNKFELASLFLALGFNAKLFPVLLLPLMMLKTGWKNRIKMTGIFVFTFLALNTYLIVKNFNVWKITYLFHGVRVPNIDSVWALTGLNTSLINALSLGLFVTFYLLLTCFHKRYSFIRAGFLAVLIFLITNKIFSPQYILWLLPFFVLFPPINKTSYYILEVLNLIVFFAASAWLLISRDALLLAITDVLVVVRSAVLLYLAYLIITKHINPIQQPLFS